MFQIIFSYKERDPSFLCLMVRMRLVTLIQTALGQHGTVNFFLCLFLAHGPSVISSKFILILCLLSNEKLQKFLLWFSACFSLALLPPIPHNNLTILLRRPAVFKVPQVFNFTTPILSKWQKLCWFFCLKHDPRLEVKSGFLGYSCAQICQCLQGKKLGRGTHLSSPLQREFPGLISCFQIPCP